MLRGIHPYAEEMARVTKRFSEAYWERKLDDNVLDFNDLEHLTLQILANRRGRGAQDERRERLLPQQIRRSADR